MTTPVRQDEELTVSPLVGAQATGDSVGMSVMALPSKANPPHAYRNLDNEADIQGPEDYWDRVSGRPDKPAADSTHATSTRNIGSLL